MKFDIVYDIPLWATIYLAYDEDEELTLEDREEVDAFITLLREKYNVVRFIKAVDSSEQVFNKYPSFGKPCGTQDWIVEVEED